MERPRSSAEIAARRPEEVASVFYIGFGFTNAEWSTRLRIWGLEFEFSSGAP